MPRFIANLSMLFTEQPLIERFAAARAAGFDTVEVQFPYDHDPLELRRALADAGVSLFLFNLPAGLWEEGDRGIAALPDRVLEFREGVAIALEYAKVLGVRHLNCLAGRADPAGSVEAHWRTLRDNVRYAADALRDIDATVLVEPINRYDIPDFFLNTSAEALRLLDEAGAANTALQYDVYHMQRSEGELAGTLRKQLARIGHIQIADNPGRHQPGSGEINFGYLLRELDRMGYAGFVSLEYVPTHDTVRSLEWLASHGFSL